MNTPLGDRQTNKLQQRTKSTQKVVKPEPKVKKKTKPMAYPYLPIGTVKLFDKLTNRALLFSSILNMAQRRQDNDLAFLDFSSTKQVTTLLNEYKEKAAEIWDKLFGKRNYTNEPDAPQSIKIRLEDHKARAIREGKNPMDFKEDNSFFEERITWESRFYVINKEIEHLEKALTNCVAEVVKVDNSKVLMHNVQGSGKLLDGSLAYLDFQPVRKAKDGILCIDCEASPYHQIAAYDYINQVVKPASALRNKVLKAKADLTKQLYNSGVESSGIKFETIKLEKEFFTRYPQEEIATIQFRGQTLPDPTGITRHLFNGEVPSKIETKENKVQL